MKTGIFTDSHYSSAEISCSVRYNNKSLGKIKKAIKYFESEKCDLIVCLGDLTDTEESHGHEIRNLREIKAVFDECDIPIYAVMGNHDGFDFGDDEFYLVLGEKYRPQTVSQNGTMLLFLDACYYSDGEKYRRGREDWTDTYFPFCDNLKKELCNAKGDVYIFIHQSLDPCIEPDHRVNNADEVCSVISESGKVKSVYQGHYHPGMKSIHGGTEYVTFPAMCEREDAYFIIEI